MSLSRRDFLKAGAALSIAGAAVPLWPNSRAYGSQPGPFQPTWQSLAQYQIPDWFRDAKFGIWAHWGPQCVPEQGDWYARQMYQEGNPDYLYQCAHYGHPSVFGFKDIDNIWRVYRWDPEHLISLYQKAGAKYFAQLACHHDNLDLWDSQHQPWNSVAVGPKRDLVGGWKPFVRQAGMRYMVSVHASHAWSWYEVAQGADKSGPFAGVPYDGKLTKADGVGKWWEGLDPQDLYAQNHTPGPGGLVWDWNVDRGSSVPDAAYIAKFYNRVVDLIEQHDPDLVYFDDTILPLYPISDVGLRLAAYYYNRSLQRRGKLDVVVTGKGLNDDQKKCIVWDIERGYSDKIEPLHWQTDTCIGQWHYSRSVFENHQYKTADQVTHMLIDIVSKNGNLMLNIPLPGYGEPDSDELDFLAQLAAWMEINHEGIFYSRPWRSYGEGPSTQPGAVGAGAGNFNEKSHSYGPQDFRFTQLKGNLYAYLMAWPDHDTKVTIASLSTNGPSAQAHVGRVELLGRAEPLPFTRDSNGLTITVPPVPPSEYVHGFKISGSGLTV